MTDEKYKEKIKELECEIKYLRKLLEEKGISYEYKKGQNDDEIKNEKNNIDDQGKRIIPTTITEKHAIFFYRLFKGRPDVYGLRSGNPNKKTGKHGYFTQCINIWKDGICPKKADYQITCIGCKNQKYKELTVGAILNHLNGNKENGSDVIGLYPMFSDETINFLVFDFDCHDETSGDDGANIDTQWKDEVNAFRKICENNEVPILVERSRSGKGHIYGCFLKSHFLQKKQENSEHYCLLKDRKV